MGYRSLAECVRDLEKVKQLVVIDQEVDPYLEVAAIQRRVYQAGGPALLFRRAKGTSFPLVGNLFGTLDRAKFIFRDALESVRRLVELKVDPGALAKNPWRYRGTPRTLLRLLPRRVRSGPILAHQIAIDQLPQIQCWPMDGGPFITLPQVYTEDPDRPGLSAVEPGDVPGSARGQSSMSPIARLAFIIRFTAESAYTTRRRFGGEKRCG